MVLSVSPMVSIVVFILFPLFSNGVHDFSHGFHCISQWFPSFCFHQWCPFFSQWFLLFFKQFSVFFQVFFVFRMMSVVFSNCCHAASLFSITFPIVSIDLFQAVFVVFSSGIHGFPKFCDCFVQWFSLPFTSSSLVLSNGCHCFISIVSIVIPIASMFFPTGFHRFPNGFYCFSNRLHCYFLMDSMVYPIFIACSDGLHSFRVIEIVSPIIIMDCRLILLSSQ